MKQKLIFIDVETTGVNPDCNGLTQISGCVQVDDEVAESFDYFVRPFPQDVIENSALEVTGIDRRQFLPPGHPDHPVEHGIVKITLTRQIDEICLVVGDIVIELHRKTPHARGQANPVDFQAFLVVKEKIDGVVLSQHERGFLLGSPGIRRTRPGEGVRPGDGNSCLFDSFFVTLLPAAQKQTNN